MKAQLFLRPCLRLSIAFIWIYTGIISLVCANTQGFPLLQQAGMSVAWQPVLLYGGAGIDLALGLLTLFNYRIYVVGLLQTLLIVTFTVIASVYLPGYWLHPLAPLAKNIPILAATWVMMSFRNSQ